jgi:hypothetical protein
MVSGIPSRRVSQTLCFVAVALLIASSIGCGGSAQGSTGGPTPTPTPVVSPTPTPTPGPAGALLMSVGSATVPTGGIFQYQLLLTEPKPIGNSSTRPNIPSGPVGPVRGVAVNDSSGQAVGIAVINGTDIKISVNSPNASLGTDVDYPLLVLTMPVVATSGSFPMTMDPSSTFFDGSNQYSIQENNPGTLTIGGTMSITDVIPGGGLIRPGDTVRILGMGFDANTKIQMNNVNAFSKTTLVSSAEIDVTIDSLCVPESNPCQPASSLALDGDRVRAIKNNETVEYFSYDRTDDAPGSSNNSLVNSVHPMFSQQHFLSGTFPFKAGGTQFTGIALQNTDASLGATVQIDLLDVNGNPVVSPAAVLLVGARKKLVRDIADLFTGIPSSAVTVRATVTTGPAVKMLGMLGDTSNGGVVPVIVTGQ